MGTVKTSVLVVTALVVLAVMPVLCVAVESVAAIGEAGGQQLTDSPSRISVDSIVGSGKEAVSPQITGFRSALFGMSTSETLEALQRDFQLGQADIVEQTNDEERTTSLVATVPDLFPGSGPARVVYIYGYKQKKLIQINIVWDFP